MFIVSGDFNDNNRTDLAVANSGTNNVGIFLGKGNGDFSEKNLLSIGLHSRPNFIAVGHLNNDMLLDIAIANYGANNINVLLNKGNGTFGEQTTYPLDDTSPYTIAIADTNKDKHSDLVVVGADMDNIGILLGHGNGYFSRPIKFVTGFFSSISVAIDDLNKDDLPDLVIISNDTNSVSIFFSKDSGFQSEAIYSTSIDTSDTSLYIGYTSQLSITNTRSDNKEVRIRRQDAPATCMGHIPHYRIPHRSFDTVVDDINNDGHLDMVVGHAPSDAFIVFLGYGNGSFARETIYVFDSDWLDLKIADFNGDGRLDIVVAYGPSELRDVAVLLGYGNGSFANPITHSLGIFSALTAVGDFNNDTISDLILSNSDNGSIDILLGYGNGSFAHPITHLLGFDPRSVVIGDFNDDTILDVVVLYTFVDGVSVFLGYGNGSFASSVTFLANSVTKKRCSSTTGWALMFVSFSAL